MSDKFVCAKCGYPAANSSSFKELESPYRDTGSDCPKCGPTEIVPERSFAFEWGWEIIHESGVSEKIKEIPGTYLQLSMIDDDRPKGTMQYETLPTHVKNEFIEKHEAINKILKEVGISEKLAKLGVNLRYNITVFDSK